MKPEVAIDLVRQGLWALIDVRSENEFEHGAVPGFVNLPILKDPERHEVGLTYKQEGSARAVEVGERLVGPHQSARIASWADAVANSNSRRGLIACWRGGMRSEIATHWIRSAGIDVERIEGGYKALRRLLLATFSSDAPVVILSGLTGSGKTKLLRSLPPDTGVDLEALACHRGSSFGKMRAPQPSQGTFENALGLSLWRRERVLLEDESASIGRIMLPQPLRERMTNAPVIVLDADLETRVDHAFQEYVVEPMAAGVPWPELKDALMTSVHALTKRIGGEVSARLQAQIGITRAVGGQPPEAARTWIRELLENYYDKAYQYAFARRPRTIIFRGNFEECRQWILEQFVSPKP